MNIPEQQNLSERQLSALVALPNAPCNDPNELILLDSKWLSFNRNIEGPFTIAKTKFMVEEGAEWTAFLGDGSKWTVLLSSDESESIESPINIIEILGHKLTVMPWQSLIVRSKGFSSSSSVCFIETLKMGQ